MWENVTLPYFKNDLQFPLPTPDEIRNCTTILRERSTVKIVAINDDIVVKYGGAIHESEGHALIFLERHCPNIPAPRLYAMYRDSKQLFLVMERVRGQQLDKLWPSLSSTDKDAICSQLREIFNAMAAVPCPEAEFFGGLDGNGLRHPLFYSQDGTRTFLGPYHGESAFVQGLIGNLRALGKANNRPPYKVNYWETHLARVLKGHNPRFTHSDVQMKNIMVAERCSSETSNETRSFDVVLVDWESAGWYPDYWEYFEASSFSSFRAWEDDWCWYLTQFLEVMPAEAAVMYEFNRDMM